jgi:hypothetical protein
VTGRKVARLANAVASDGRLDGLVAVAKGLRYYYLARYYQSALVPFVHMAADCAVRREPPCEYLF